jgi:hypothetical protein
MKATDTDKSPFARVDLVITSTSMEPEELESGVGLAADRTWRRGDRLDPHGVRPERRRVSGVRYRSGTPGTTPVGAQLAALCERLRPFQERVAALAAELARTDGRADSVRLWIYVDASGTSAHFSFAPDLLADVIAMSAHHI